MNETFGTSYPLWYYLMNAGIIVAVCLAAFLVVRGVFRFAVKNKDKAGSLATKAAAVTIEATRQAVATVKSEAASVPSSVQRMQRQDEAYARAAQEIELGTMHKGLWARSFADADGNEQKQRALYIRYRADQIVKEVF